MIIEGKIYWCKLDKPRDNYNKQKKIMDKETGEPDRWGREYSVVLANLSKETKLQLRDAGILDKVRNKMDDLEDQITFRLDEFDRDGDPQCISVTNGDTGQSWDWKEDGLIGNGSFGAVKFNVWKKPNVKARIYPLSMIVLEHVEYEGEEQQEREDPDDWSSYVKAPAKGKASANKKAAKTADYDELDDEIPA